MNGPIDPETGEYAVSSMGMLNTTVPEPSTWVMLMAGFAGLGAALRGQRRRAVAA